MADTYDFMTCLQQLQQCNAELDQKLAQNRQIESQWEDENDQLCELMHTGDEKGLDLCQLMSSSVSVEDVEKLLEACESEEATAVDTKAAIKPECKLKVEPVWEDTKPQLGRVPSKPGVMVEGMKCVPIEEVQASCYRFDLATDCDTVHGLAQAVLEKYAPLEFQFTDFALTCIHEAAEDYIQRLFLASCEKMETAGRTVLLAHDLRSSFNHEPWI